LAALILRKKAIITFHEVWGELWFRLPYTSKWKLRLFYLFEWFILKLPFFKYVAVSEYTKKSLIAHGISESKIVRIYNGIENEILASHRHQPPENFTFCYFGRLGISKGIELLLAATRLFVYRHPEAILKLIIPTYPKPFYEKIMHTIESLQLKSNIVLMHNLPKELLLKEVSTSSCVIIPSYSEGFCYVAVESSAMQVPVISSGKGSLPEVVSGKHIVLEELNVEGITNALEKAILNEWEKSIPKKFSLKDSIDGYLSLYRQIIEKQ
jgi:glycosyltransferase involved in cell wall biosynthesis